MIFTLEQDALSLKIISVIVAFSVIAVFIAIAIDFSQYDGKSNVKKSKRSMVATGSMFGFFAVYYLILRFRIGACPGAINLPLTAAGTLMIVTGAVINVIGRVQLGSNWANQIKIYQDHTLIQAGIYNWVRHPLYASLILMLFGGSLTYSNWLSALLSAFIFVPFMNYRAQQEEVLLLSEFPQYRDYIRKTGRFFPKLRRLKK